VRRKEDDSKTTLTKLPDQFVPIDQHPGLQSLSGNRKVCGFRRRRGVRLCTVAGQ
jgi:hypothetical protein